MRLTALEVHRHPAERPACRLNDDYLGAMLDEVSENLRRKDVARINARPF